jgi:hypothetical protein
MPKTTEVSDLIRRFESLIARHAELRSKEVGQLTKVLNELLPGFLAERKNWAQAQRKTADDFNLFQVMGVDAAEVCHSTLLAWLLDHRIEGGTHAQGPLGFRLFLEELRRELQEEHGGDVTSYAEVDYWVRAEVSGDEARVDIEIAAQNSFLIHIENKIYSAEGDSQTNREWRDLQARRRELGVPEDRCHALFLTLDGRRAQNVNFRSVGWNRIARILNKFADQAEPPEVKLFARHYSKAIRKLSAMEREEMEGDDGDV